jgi:hypothetical protein
MQPLKIVDQNPLGSLRVMEVRFLSIELLTQKLGFETPNVQCRRGTGRGKSEKILLLP